MLYVFLRIFFQFFWSFLRHSFYLTLGPGEVKYLEAVIFVSDNFKNRLSDIIFDKLFLMMYSPLIFICIILYAKQLSGVLRQRRAIYSELISGCANYASFSPQSTFFNSARITYFCMRMTPTNVFYLCMIFVCGKLSQTACLREATPKPEKVSIFFIRDCNFSLEDLQTTDSQHS